MTLNEIPEVLVVEDDPQDRELTLRALRRANLANAIRIAEDGVAALDYLLGDREYETSAPSLVLLDLKLPKLSGLEVLARLRAEEKTRLVPVVVLTSSKEDRDIERAYELGVNSYIVKPVEFDSFVKAVGRIGFYWLLLNQHPEA
ncbi:MAG: response regulator [Thermoanaerobaculia bacterium]|nr:response regulator [Thermoanaerobaculia bacterium]